MFKVLIYGYITFNILFGGDKMLDRIRPTIAQQLNIDEDKVTLNASFIDDLGADSLDMVELIMAIEEEFEFEVPEEDAENIVTVGDAINYIKSKINE